MSKISMLQGNLAETYVALHSMNAKSNAIPLRVIAREEGHYKLCYQGSWLGWIDRFFGNKQSDELVKMAIKDTIENLFKKCMKEVLTEYYTKTVTNYVKLINNSVKLKDEKDSEVGELQKRLKTHLAKTFSNNLYEASMQDISHLADSFGKNMQESIKPSTIDDVREKTINLVQAVRSFCQFCCIDDSSKQLLSSLKQISPDALIFNKTFFSSFSNIADFLNLEGILEQEIPIETLIHVLQKQELSTYEKDRLKKWIKKLNENQTKISVKEFERVLKEIISLFYIAGHEVKIEDLALLLDEWGCELVSREDIEFTAERDNLERGDFFFCNNASFTLSDECTGKLIRNKHRVFNVVGKDNENFVVTFASNRFDLKIQAAKMKKEKWHWGVQLAEIQEISDEYGKKISGLDEDGLCVITEKLHCRLSDIEWKSKDGAILKEEEDKLLAICSHLYCMQRWNAMPKNMSPSILFFDKKGILKTTHLLKKVAFIYNKLEEFCILVANGNIFVLNFLMKVSGLFRHPIAVFYRNPISYTLLTGKTDDLSRNLPKGHANKSYQTHIDSLYIEANDQRELCFLTVRADLRQKKKYTYNESDPNDDLLRDKVYKKLEEIYKTHPTSGVLSKSLIDEVVESFYPKKGVPPKTNDTYFKSRFDLMTKYNRASLDAEAVSH